MLNISNQSENIEKGFALPLTLIVLAMLMTMALSLLHTSSQRVNNVRILKDRWHNQLEMQNMLNIIVWNLLIGKKYHNKIVNDHVIIPVDGRFFEMQGMRLEVQDDSGLIPLEFFQQKPVFYVMKNMRGNVGGKNPAAILGDWIDVDNIPRIEGLEKPAYLTLKYKYMLRNHPLRTLDELLEVPFIDYKLFNGIGGKRGLRDVLVLGSAGAVNYATAPNEVLAALLPLNNSLLTLAIEARNQENWSELMRIIYLMNGEGVNPLTPGVRFLIKIRSIDKTMLGRFDIMLRSQEDGRAFQVNLWQLPDFPRG